MVRNCLKLAHLVVCMRRIISSWIFVDAIIVFCSLDWYDCVSPPIFTPSVRHQFIFWYAMLHTYFSNTACPSMLLCRILTIAHHSLAFMMVMEVLISIYVLINFLNVCLFYHYYVQHMSLVSKPDLGEKCAWTHTLMKGRKNHDVDGHKNENALYMVKSWISDNIMCFLGC